MGGGTAVGPDHVSAGHQPLILHDRLMALRREVYNRYHPPRCSQIFVQPNEPKDAKEGDVWVKG